MTAEESIITALRAHAPMVGIVGDRIYPTYIPDEHDEPRTPWLMYLMSDSDPLPTLANESGEMHRFKFDLLTDSYAELKALEAALRGALSAAIAAPVRSCVWAGTTRDVVDEGHHAEVQFEVLEAY
jgi:Protein of unknown function (DUF3168)